MFTKTFNLISVIYYRLRSELLYHPFGRIIHWILNQPVAVLIILYVFTYVTLVFGFAFLYKNTDKIWDSKEERFATEFNDSLHFSFTTQTTLGYGDLSPRDSARVLTALQTIFGVVLNALVLGLIVIRIIRRSPKIMFASNVVYNRISHELNFWFWNRDADDFCNTKVDVILKRIEIDV